MAELVSIIIPTYNAEQYLEECLDSVVSQTYPDLEVIVINDGSYDASEAIIKRYAASFPAIQYHSQENRGLGFTRNMGIGLSKGKYLFFLDADDTMPENAIRSLVKAAEKSEADYAVGKVVRFNEERKYVPIRHVDFNLYTEKKLTSLKENPELLQDSIACNKLWSKRFLTRNQLFFKEGKNYEDLSFTMKAAVLAEKILVLDQVVYHWRVRDDEEKPSITQQQMKLANTIDRLEALDENRQWLLDHNADFRIIEEHDLKSLLDVLRLHVLKYALTSEQDREQWKRAIISYLIGIPVSAVENLPEKERLLHQLALNKNFADLLLLSQVLTNTESLPLVIQDQQNRLVLQGENQLYDVTFFYKPTMVLNSIEKQRGGQCKLTGQLWIPKASQPSKGRFYAENRATKENITVAELQLDQVNKAEKYPYEHQNITVFLDLKVLTGESKEATFDFYFESSIYPASRPTRVRLYPTADNSGHYSTKKYEISFYRTNYSNLSLKIAKSNKLKPLLKKVLRRLNQ